MSRFFKLLLIIGVLFICALWSPWNYWNFSFARLFGVEPPPEIGGLQVTSLAGEIEVFIDGVSQGKAVAEQAPLIIPAVEPGERRISLKRISTVTGAFWELNRLVRFESGVDVVMSYELGPTADFSGGHTIFATKSNAAFEGVKLNLVAAVNEAAVELDDVEIGLTPLTEKLIDISKQHKLKISKAGYEAQEFTLLPAEQVDRNKINGYVLNVLVDLFLQPLTIDDQPV